MLESEKLVCCNFIAFECYRCNHILIKHSKQQLLVVYGYEYTFLRIDNPVKESMESSYNNKKRNSGQFLVSVPLWKRENEVI